MHIVYYDEVRKIDVPRRWSSLWNEQHSFEEKDPLHRTGVWVQGKARGSTKRKARFTKTGKNRISKAREYVTTRI